MTDIHVFKAGRLPHYRMDQASNGLEEQCR